MKGETIYFAPDCEKATDIVFFNNMRAKVIVR